MVPDFLKHKEYDHTIFYVTMSIPSFREKGYDMNFVCIFHIV